MCGLFGAIGPGINPLIIRALAIANRSRGKESIGFFDSTGKKIKSASDPTECLTRSNFSAFIERKHWFIAGHTRKATRGSINKKNAHPFRFGNYIGSHNGQVTAPAEYDVDSMFLFDRLHNCKGNYSKAFEGIAGYWALTWYDGAHFYLQAHDNRLHLARKGNTWYYSSDKDHLSAALGKADEWLTLENGATIRFHKDGRLEKLEAFTSTTGRGGYRKAATSGYGKASKATTATVSAETIKLLRDYRSKYGNDIGGYDGHYDNQPSSYGRDGYGPSSMNQRLTMSELHEADDWAHECGYKGFYHFMSVEGYSNEYSCYLALSSTVDEQREQDYEDSMYEDWDNEQVQRESDGMPFETYDDWSVRQDRKDRDFQQWAEDREAGRSLFPEDEDGIDHQAGYENERDVMDAEFEHYCNRDEISDGRIG